jgi:hypothetical protein
VARINYRTPLGGPGYGTRVPQPPARPGLSRISRQQSGPSTSTWSGPTTGLTHRWPMDDAHVSGATVKDVVGGVDGTATSTADITSGFSGAGRHFDRVGWVNLPSLPVSLAAAHTVGFWISFADLTIDAIVPTPLCFTDAAGNFLRFSIDSAPGDPNNYPIVILMSPNDLGSVRCETSGIVPLNTPMHFAYTFDGVSTITLYKDGVPLGNIVSAAGLYGSGDASSYVIGAKQASAPNGRINADMRDLALYDRALSAAEITQLFQATDTPAGIATTWDPNHKTGPINFTNGNMTAACPAGGYDQVFSTNFKTTGKWAYEVRADFLTSDLSCGIGTSTGTASPAGLDRYIQVGFNAVDSWYCNNEVSAAAPNVVRACTRDDVLTFAYDHSTGLCDVYLNGVILFPAVALATGNIYSFAIPGNGFTAAGKWAAPFDYAVPTGYSVWDAPAGPGTDGLSDITALAPTPALPTPALGQKHALTATAVAPTPALPTPAIGQKHALTVTALAPTPALAVPALGQQHALSVTALAPTPALAAPALGQTHALAATALAPAPALPTPALGQTHALSITALAPTPALASPALGQTHVLALTPVAPTPALPVPGLGQTHALALVALALTPVLPTPTASAAPITVALAATPLAPVPALPTPALAQRHVLALAPVAPTPALASPTLGQVHALAASPLAPAPAVPSPALAQRHVLALAAIAPAPSLPTPAVGQLHALASVAVAPIPALPAPALGQRHVLAVVVLAPIPAAPMPAIGQVHALSVGQLVAVPVVPSPSMGGSLLVPVPAPVLPSPALGQRHALAAVVALAPSPALATPAIGQAHALSLAAPVPRPELPSPTVGQIQGLAIFPPVPSFAPPAPVIGQLHLLSVANFANGPPSLATPAMRQGQALAAPVVPVPAPAFPTLALGQRQAFAALPPVPTPDLPRPQLGQVHSLTADSLAARAIAPTPAFAQAHALALLELVATPELPPPLDVGGYQFVVDLALLFEVGARAIVATPTLRQVHALVVDPLVIGRPQLPDLLFRNPERATIYGRAFRPKIVGRAARAHILGRASRPKVIVPMSSEQNVTFHSGETWMLDFNAREQDGSPIPLSDPACRVELKIDRLGITRTLAQGISLSDAAHGAGTVTIYQPDTAVPPGFYDYQLVVWRADGSESVQTRGRWQVLKRL